VSKLEADRLVHRLAQGHAERRTDAHDKAVHEGFVQPVTDADHERVDLAIGVIRHQ
jgi:hydrogenase/urease accessory protein HupE